jgi:hypothetical protein
MKSLVAVIVVLVVVFFAAPMVAEGTTNSCQALEKHVVSQQASKLAGGNTNSPVYNAVNGVGQAGATGQIASTMMNQNHPDAPSPVSCTYYFWKSMF